MRSAGERGGVGAMRRRIVVLLAIAVMAVMAVTLWTAMPPAFTQDVCVEELPGGGSGACELNPGQSEGSSAQQPTPPTEKPGVFRRSSEANEHDTNRETGRGERFYD